MTSKPLAARLGRFGLASLFLLAGLNKLLDPASTVAMMEGAGLPFADRLVWAVVAVEIGCGALLVWGGRLGAAAAVALALFTIAATLVFHRFWELDGEMAALRLSLFFKNAAIASALVYVAATEATDGR
ncbi:MAG: DoxX family protein [Pseudomonadota bacterium]